VRSCALRGQRTQVRDNLAVRCSIKPGEQSSFGWSQYDRADAFLWRLRPLQCVITTYWIIVCAILLREYSPGRYDAYDSFMPAGEQGAHVRWQRETQNCQPPNCQLAKGRLCPHAIEHLYQSLVSVRAAVVGGRVGIG